MKKVFQISFLTVITIALIVSLAFAGSEVFEISVTMPAIPGVNAPALTQNDVIDAQTIVSGQEEWKSLAFFQDIDYEEIANGEKKIMVETITDF